MGISVEATAAKFAALVVEARRCLALGVDMKASYLKDLIAQIEYASVTDLSGRTDVSPDTKLDGRNTVEETAIA